MMRRPRRSGANATGCTSHQRTATNCLKTCRQTQIFILSISSLLILLLSPSWLHIEPVNNQFVFASETNATTNKSQAPPPKPANPDQPTPATTNYKLDCQPGEQRQFSYESSTKVWGSSNQQVRLTAVLRVKCMEPPTNTTLKYLAEIISLKPNFLADGQEEQEQRTDAKRAKLKQQSQKVLRTRQSIHAGPHSDKLLYLDGETGQPRAEPLFEEVGEAAIRMKRSVSGWFSRAWISVKDFFGNIFTSSERSSVSREQAFRETGLDIAGQCKAPTGGKGKGIQGLPFDESVFEDLGPEYYVGASSLGGATTAYEFSGGERLFGPLDPLDDDDLPDSALSFFDDPKPAASRSRRAAPSQQQLSGGRKSKSATNSGDDYNRLLKIPFVFLQSRTGKIIEVRFSGDESDLSVKNFKRHLCDLFATNLDVNRTATNEVSPIGKHQTKYTVDSSANSIDALKEAVIKSADNNSSSEAGKQLVRVLAMVGTNNRQHGVAGGNKKSGAGNQDDPELVVVVADDDDEDETSEVIEGSQRTAPGSAEISVLRSINTTSSVQLSSKMLASDIDRMEVRVKQVQQINEGRMVGTAGQMSMSLVQPQGGAGVGSSSRNKRQAAPFTADSRTPGADQENIEDISELLQVSTSFSMQLVPMTTNSAADSTESAGASAKLQRGKRAPASDVAKLNGHSINGTTPTKKWKAQAKKRAAHMVEMAPKDSQELQRVLREWRKQEARLQLSATNLVSETSDPLESEQQRLDVLRDQIRQRLNEEFVRNRIRRSLSAHSSRQQHVAALSQSTGTNQEHAASEGASNKRLTGNDLGLGLTQLVLGNGITTRKKGSIYATIEEVMELEATLSDEYSEPAISRLMRDTVRMDKMREHCRATIPSLDVLCEAYKRPQAARMSVERTLPFGLKESEDNEHKFASSSGAQKLGQQQQRTGRRLGPEANEFESKNDRKFEQCRNVLQLMLKLNDRQAVNLAVELVDECNQRLLVAAKSEELGYGPVGKYYRHLRQQLVDLLGRVARPSDSLVDKLLLRLYYPKLAGVSDGVQQKPAHKSSTRRRDDSVAELPEFVYVGSNGAKTKETTTTTKYNRSLLKDEDDFNNNDGAGQLVMTLTALAAKPSVSRAKRVEVVEKLLQSLRGTSCSLFNAPDLDIIESMAQFQEPIEELAARVISLARRCRQHDQYQVACVHGLAGQLGQPVVQRFFSDQLRSPNASCTVKSEIVLTLIGAQLVQDLRQQQTRNETNEWPSHGTNRLDETLVELLDNADKQREPDRKCLKQLAAHYFARKHSSGGGGGASASFSLGSSGKWNQGRASRSRARRSVVNENNFWDESHCKRWTMPSGVANAADLPNDLSSILSARNDSLGGVNKDLVDEIDDNSIISAMMNQQQWQREAKASRSFRGRNQKASLLERELEQPSNTNSSSNGSSISSQLSATRNSLPATAVELQSFLRRRHKCTASKNFGPRNAQASLRAEIVNDLIGSKDENKFLARFRLSTNFLGNRIDVGRMYLWHQRQTTRAYANILGRSIWDTSQGCKDKAPHQMLYMPLFDFNLWLVKVSVGLRLSAEMGFFSNCQGEEAFSMKPDLPPPTTDQASNATTSASASSRLSSARLATSDELQLYPTVGLRAAGEATAKLVVARAGMSVASHYGYQGSISVSRQPDSCMSIYSAHQPMNVTFSSWFQLWDNDCHFWGSRSRAEPQAIKWRLMARKPMVWLEDECLAGGALSNSSTTNHHPMRPDGTTQLDDKKREPGDKSTSRSTISP